MTWLKTVLAAIVGIKDIVKAIKQLLTFFTAWYKEWQDRRRAEKLAKAVAKAKKTKDTSDIEKITRGK